MTKPGYPSEILERGSENWVSWNLVNCLTGFWRNNLSHSVLHSDTSAFQDGIFESKVYGKTIIPAGRSKTAIW